MKSSCTHLVILVLQAVLVMGIFAAVAKENAAVGENMGNRETNGGKLKCCTNCNFSFSGLYSLHLRRHRQEVRPRLQGLLRREDASGQAVPVHRHFPRHLRAPLQEALRSGMG
ncbi:hypothetical protein QOZ80_1AG0008380 [Eleusine coracana subsp. coracana]|nr:hypothetical protein QOZ80_1AG0008380 [Eleusine coracana subsp. coracana]